jgi:hypothetical protein
MEGFEVLLPRKPDLALQVSLVVSTHPKRL